MDFYRPTTTQCTLVGLGTFYRAVRAWRFYPKGHPTRRSALILAHSVLLELLDGNTLSLVCGRTGFSFPDEASLIDSPSGKLTPVRPLLLMSCLFAGFKRYRYSPTCTWKIWLS